MNNISMTCPQCGAVFIRGDKFCRACGHWHEKAGGVKTAFQSFVLLSVTAAAILGFVVYAMVTAQPKTGFVHPEVEGMDRSRAVDMQAFMASLPADYAGLVAQGNMNMDHGHYAEAVICYDRAISLDDSSADVRTDLGACYHALGQIDSALVQLGKALQLDPNHAVAHFNMGVVYHSAGDMAKTRQYWNRYLELLPDSPIADTLKSILNSF